MLKGRRKGPARGQVIRAEPLLDNLVISPMKHNGRHHSCEGTHRFMGFLPLDDGIGSGGEHRKESLVKEDIRVAGGRHSDWPWRLTSCGSRLAQGKWRWPLCPLILTAGVHPDGGKQIRVGGPQNH